MSSLSSQARYSGRRKAKPLTINSYCAINEVRHVNWFNQQPETRPVGLAPDVYCVNHDVKDDGQLQHWEFKCRLSDFYSNSPLLQSLYEHYDEFRIRSLRVSVRPLIKNPTNASRGDAWLWWLPNHVEDDDSKQQGFADTTALNEASKVQYLGQLPGRGFSVHYVPQITDQEDIYVGGLVYEKRKDEPMPFVPTEASFRDNLILRGPIFHFRKPYQEGGSPEPAHFLAADLHAVIEFRNLSYGDQVEPTPEPPSVMGLKIELPDVL